MKRIYPILGILVPFLSSCIPFPINEKQFQETAIINAVTQISYQYAIKSTIEASVSQTISAIKPTATIEPKKQEDLNNQILSKSNRREPTLPPNNEKNKETNNIPLTDGDRAEFITESISDGTDVAIDQNFEQTWVFLNSGQNTWTTEYSIVYIDGFKFPGPERIKLDIPVPPGKLLKISGRFQTPSTKGRYRSYWMLENRSGVKFGLGETNRSFWIEIDAVNQISPTIPLYPTTTPLPTLQLLPTLAPLRTVAPLPTLPQQNTVTPNNPIYPLPTIPTLPEISTPDPLLPLPTIPPPNVLAT